MWNFIHHLSADQYKSYVAISTKMNHTVTEYYADCRAICNAWIRDSKNTPKLGGFGKLVEMDKSYFRGQSIWEDEGLDVKGTRQNMEFWAYRAWKFVLCVDTSSSFKKQKDSHANY